MLSKQEERAVHLLASGLPPIKVASVLGVSPALLSQYNHNEEFRTALEAAEAEMREKDIEDITLTAKYHAAEHALIDRVTGLVETSEMRDVLSALKVVAERQDRAKERINPNPVGGNTTINNTVVNLSMPTHAIPEFKKNEINQVIAIDSKPLAPLSSKGVVNLFQRMQEQKLLEKQKEKENDTRRIIEAAERSPQEAIQTSFSF